MKKISNVFYLTVALVILAVSYGLLAPESFEAVTNTMKEFISRSFGWYYMLLLTFMVAFSVFIILSPFGKIRLGKDTDRPEYSTMTWIAMLFSAGMGIGLVFYGAAEPLSHYILNPATEEAGTNAAFREAMRQTFFHWGLHAWATYGVVALALAFFQFRKGEPGLISATLKPLFGDKMNGPLGILIDVLAVFATVFGVATTLGFGAVQINGGLAYLFNVPISPLSQFIIIAIVTVLFIASAWSGLSKGIKYLSNTNMVLAIALLFIIVIVGPTLLIFNMFTDSIGAYLQQIVRMSFRTEPLNNAHREWLNHWTIFYWAWWISWSPFVGTFIARVSKGRTIREFLIGVLIVPTILCAFWFSAFGSTAINVQRKGVDLSGFTTEQTLFAVFSELPLSLLLSLIAITLIGLFFITSADSATFVLGMQSTFGSLQPPNTIKLIWGIMQSFIAGLLLSVGGLTAIQNTIIIAAFPFSFIMVLMIFSLFKAMKSETKVQKRKVP